MGAVIIVVALIFLFLYLNRKFEGFRQFNRRNAGFVLYFTVIWGIYAWVFNERRVPSFLSFYFLLAYGVVYRLDTLKLVGLLKAYPEEPVGWKFTATLTTGVSLIGIFFVTKNLLIIGISGAALWSLVFEVTKYIQGSVNYRYFNFKKLVFPISAGVASSVVAILTS